MSKMCQKKPGLTHRDLIPYPHPGGVHLLIELPGHKICPICGGKTRHAYRQACSDSWCAMSSALEPRFTDPTRARNNQPKFSDPKLKYHNDASSLESKMRRRAADQERLLAPLVPWTQSISQVTDVFTQFDFSDTSWFVGNEWIGKDRRGEDDPTINSIWSKTSRVTCCFKAIGGSPALNIRRNYAASVVRTVVKNLLGGNRETLDRYDLFFAWRCGCEVNTEVIYKDLEDLPDSLGYHDACPKCGQAPLEVLPTERVFTRATLF